MNAYEQFMADLYCPDRLREQHNQLAGLTAADDAGRPSGLLLWFSRLAALLRKPAVKVQDQGAIVPQPATLLKV